MRIIKDCTICNVAIEVDNDRDFIFSMADVGPYCELCWMDKQAIGADIIMDSLFGKQSQELLSDD